MNKLESRELVPELRFPEFIASQEWRLTTFGEEAIFINGKAYKQDELLDKGKYRVLRVGNFFTNKEWYYSDLELDKDKYCDDGDLLYAWSASFGPRIWSGEKVIYHYHIWKVVEKEGVDKKFLYAILDFETEKMKAQSANGLGLLHITKGAIENWKCTFPKQKEQKKIADCLSSMDDLITSNTKKLESLELHRKGLMQRLFPEEGKSIPEFGFACNVKWIKKTFEEVYSLKTTNSLSRDKLNYDEGLVKNIHYGDIHTKFSTLFDITKEYVPFISEEISLDKIKQESYCKEGDMVFADASEDIDDVGKSIELININGEKLLSGLHTILARQKESYLVKGFGGYLFKSEVMRRQIQKESQGAKVLGISSGRISKIDVIYPIEQSEQQRIVDCLSSLDKLIDAQTKKIEVLNKYKKGLMQKLFPEVKEFIA
ncbi:restriction endonuclease subunit S [Vibrio parahaemolyticus]|uniref:restriction endonuclease subunit S n=1 Tax=Vibrio parahaemolyticus TaxID=670 RepID=UPI000418719B|nr:restriction endonuclease subunit S [Vibrio parahaemolyticus]